jgi:hypothetical protein
MRVHVVIYPRFHIDVEDRRAFTRAVLMMTSRYLS